MGGAGPLLSVRDVAVERGGRWVLDGLDLEVRQAQSVAVVGPSGSGKTTLLHVACGLITPDRGKVEVAGEDLGAASEAVRAKHRLRELGVVFQFADLLPELTLRDNVELPMRFAGTVPRAQILSRADALLAELGVGHIGGNRPDAVSGGERQRAAVARALANSPRVVLADEPTGSLDPETAVSAVETLLSVVRTRSAALVLVTHNPAIADLMDRRLVLHKGRLTEDGTSS